MTQPILPTKKTYSKIKQSALCFYVIHWACLVHLLCYSSGPQYSTSEWQFRAWFEKGCGLLSKDIMILLWKLPVQNHTNEKQRCVEQKVVAILGLSVFKQQHTQELKHW